MTQTSIQKDAPVSDLQKIICLFDDDFSIDWILELSDWKPTRVLAELENAMQLGWLERTGPGRYIFTNAKKREQLQACLGAEEKDRLYRSVARLFLKEYRDNHLDAAKLATFLLNITNDAAGCRGLLLAGDALIRNYQPDRALECYKKLKKDAAQLEGRAVDALFIEMAVKFSKVSTAMQSTTEVLETLQDAMGRAVKRKDVASQALIQMHLAKNEWLLNRFDRALKTFRKGWALANRCNDARLMRSAIAFRMFSLFWQGRFKEVISHYEKANSDVEAPPQIGLPLLATITVGHCYANVGQITQGLGMLDSIKASCRAAGDKHTAAVAIAAMNSAFLSIQSVDETLQHVEQTYAEVQQSGNQYIELLTDVSLAYLYYLKGDISRSVVFLKKFVQKCRDVNVDTLHHRPRLLELCWAMEQGRYPRVLDLSLEKHVKNLIAGQNVYLKGLAYRYRALLEIHAGQPEHAIRKSLALSLQWLEASGHELDIILTQIELLRRHLAAGEQDEIQMIVSRMANALAHYNDEIVPSDLRMLIKGAPSTQSFMKEILKLGREIMTISDSKDLVLRIISNVNRLTGAERGAIFLLDEQTDAPRLTLRASINLTQEQVSHPSFESSLQFILQAATAGSDKKGFIQGSSEPSGLLAPSAGDAIRSQICVPMIFKEKVVGVLYHDNRLLNSAFKTSDFELLSFFAAQAAITLDNANAHEEIRRLNEKIQEDRQCHEERQFPRGVFKDIIGKSDAVQQMLFWVEQVAATDTNVLILGETGVGKELVANAIHYHSARKNRALIKANCSALTETLINSELFGHERGAFTGANSRRLGRFELADGGTIFLDEIGDLPLDVQANLLRVLQTNEFERVGGNETVHSNFRLIVATNHDLDLLVKEKKFRADLYFRLNVFPVRVPALRDRKEDIPLLVHHFIRHFAQKLKKQIKKVPSGEMHKLIQHNWPGNIRELENVIERGLILNSTSVFKVPELDADGRSFDKQRHAHTLEENERNHILWALEQRGWKIRGAGGVAEFLDIHPSTLAARMKKLNIRRPSSQTERA